MSQIWYDLVLHHLLVTAELHQSFRLKGHWTNIISDNVPTKTSYEVTIFKLSFSHSILLHIKSVGLLSCKSVVTFDTVVVVLNSISIFKNFFIGLEVIHNGKFTNPSLKAHLSIF